MFLFEISNNQKIANGRIKLALVLSAGLMFCIPTFAAENVMQSPTGKIQRIEDIDVVEETNGHSVRDFFSSLKLWDKKKTAQTTNSTNSTNSKPSTSKNSEVNALTPVGVATTKGKTSTTPPDSLLGSSSKKTAAPATMDSQETTVNNGFAPEPPQIPIYQNNVYQNRIDARQVSPNDVQPSNAVSYSENTSAGQSAYSFDAREWVEYYPTENVNPAVKQDSAHKGSNIRVAVQNTNQKTTTQDAVPNALETHNIVENNIAQQQSVTAKAQNLSESNFWDGGTTPLQNTLNGTSGEFSTPSPKVASAVTSKKTTPVGATEFAEQIDLSPSYKKHLPHTEICGVIVVQANFPLTEISSILSEINDLQIDLNKYMGVPSPREKIELCLFKDETSYFAFLKQMFPNAPTDRRALYIKLDKKPGTLLVQKSGENFEIDLRHEMTHAIIHASIAHVPIWLDEGLAKYFEVPLAERAEKNPYMKQVRWSVKLGTVPSLNRLTKLETADEMGTKEYRDSWAWTHFLIHRSPETHKLLAGYIQMLGQLPNSTSASKNVKLPPLTIYLNDVVSNQREEFRSHFGVNAAD